VAVIEKDCGRQCEWVVGGVLEDDCAITTTSTPTEEAGCCAGTTAKNTEMCNEKIGRESCERSGKCEFRAGEDDCAWPTTTSEPWLGAKLGAKQRRGKASAHKQESALFGGEGVISETMQSTVSLSTLMMLVVAAFAAFQLFKWWSARKVGRYTKVADIAPTATYQNSCQSV